MSQKYAAVKGMNDLRAPEIATWHRLEQLARARFAAYGFEEIRTPILEATDLFVRSVGEVTDIVKKEMYTFVDKGERSVTMRPEGTAPAVRAYVEHGVAVTEALTRWYYLGPMFRYERMKTGRYRQFYQLGAEVWGSADPATDVEVIALCHGYLQAIGVPEVVLHLNTLGDEAARPAYLERLRAHFEPLKASMSEDARSTLERNPMRLLDSKEPALQEAIASAPALLEVIDAPARAHFDQVRRLLDALEIPHVLAPKLVRGLDYYVRTTFEFIYQPRSGENALGTAGTVCGGGRYDGLVKALGGPDKPGVGFAMGLDRLVALVRSTAAAEARGPLLFVGTFEGPSREAAIALVMRLRDQGLKVDFDPRGGKLGRQNERADKVGARFFAAFGDEEQRRGVLRLKDLSLPRDTPDDAPGKYTEVSLSSLAGWLAEAGKPRSQPT